MNEYFERATENSMDLILLGGEHRGQIIALRELAYANRYASSLNKDLLTWNHIDEVSLHYGLVNREERQLQSVLRLTLSANDEVFKKILLYDFDELKWPRPFAILSRAATRPSQKDKSINFILRRYALNYVFRNNLSETVFGLVANDVKRLPPLLRMGYETIENPTPWRGCITRPKNSSYLLFLKKANYIDARA